MLNSKKISLLILALVALVCSRVLYFLVNDPEGPNLLIVVGLAGVLYAASLSAYLFNASATWQKKFGCALLIQIVVSIGLHFLLR